MYKPDPRLPPDQQMLPTHAKRLAQEQWEKDGKTGSVYDREFRLLNTDDFPHLKPSDSPTNKLDNRPPPLTQISQPADRDSQQWPLPSPKLQDKGNGEHGGYSTIPRISSQNQNGPHSGSAQ